MPAPESKRNIQARWIALLCGTAIALYLCWLMLQPFIEVLLWALVLVIVFYPVHRRILARTAKPSLSALLSSVLVIVTILVPLSLVALAVVREAAQLAEYVQANAETLFDPNSQTFSGLLSWLGRYVEVEQFRSADFQARSRDFIVGQLRNLSGTLAGRTLGFLGGFVGALVQTFFVVFTMYYLFRDGERMRGALRFALPLERSQSNEIFHRTNEVIGASVYGVLVIATIQGVIGGLAFWLLGLPSPLLWGVVMILLSMIPMLGAFLVWVPAALYLLATGHWGKALVLTLVGLFVIGTVDNFLRPKLVGEKTRLHELIIFFSVLGGLHVFGVIGLVLGPVVVAITLALLDVFRKADDHAHDTHDEKSLLEEQEALREVPPLPEAR